MHFFTLGVAIGLSSILQTLALPALIPQTSQHIFPSPASHRPLVIWHGLGDTANGEGIAGLMQDIKEMLPGIYVHSVQYPEGGSADDERKAGFYGNASMQVDAVAETIKGVPELADGFDGIGFSQGGLFMRDYVQRYNEPRVRNLLTVSSGCATCADIKLKLGLQFGSPHMGIARLIPCRSSFDLVCIIAKQTAQKGVYTEWAQNNLIQVSSAQCSAMPYADHDVARIGFVLSRS
jgi:palmitoyl-protein thioesterase